MWFFQYDIKLYSITIYCELIDKFILDYDNYDEGTYTDVGFGVMADLTWDWGLNFVLGVRYDTIDVETTSSQVYTEASFWRGNGE